MFGSGDQGFILKFLVCFMLKILQELMYKVSVSQKSASSC